MFRRKYLAATVTVAVSVSALALTGGPASAVTSNPQPDDTAGTPTSAMLIGVGSDTIQHVDKTVADAYNAQSPAPAALIYTYAACASSATCGTITLPTADITRPNGSGAGKALLYGAGNNPDIDFARSSSQQSDAETAAGLYSFPFAVDTLEMVKSGNVASDAPASLTVQQVLSIYTGAVTNWSAFGGPNATIKPLIPQSGSGTRTFFLAQLQAANGGIAPTLGGSVTDVQEHDPTPIMNDPTAIAPFSLAKAVTLTTPTEIAVEPGFSADRAVYNVVRSGDLGNPSVLAAFGSNGFFCSATGKTLIAQAGFRQLLTPSKGGVCGQPTQAPASNLATDLVNTTTSVTVSSPTSSAARITAVVSASTAPSGTVAFFEGSTQLATGVPLISGQAARIQTAAAGTHTYRAVFTPAANTPFNGSEGTGTGTVQKASSTAKAHFPKAVKFGKKAKGTVTITLSGSSAKATGTVTIKKGHKVVGTGTLKNGVAKVKLKLKKPGTYKLTASWAGDSNGTASSDGFKVKLLPKPKKK